MKIVTLKQANVSYQVDKQTAQMTNYKLVYQHNDEKRVLKGLNLEQALEYKKLCGGRVSADKKTPRQKDILMIINL